MKNILSIIFATAMLIVYSCSSDRGEHFTICGSVEGITTDTTIVLEAMTLQGIVEVGRATLSASDNRFEFAIDRQICPSFYSLRVGREALSLCVDSTETITITAHLGAMVDSSRIEGSDKCEQLRQISQRQSALLAQLASTTRLDLRTAIINNYKRAIIADFVAPDPASAVAYSALLQTINGQYIFDFEHNRSDARWLAAVATSWDYLYPNSQRARELHDAALRSMAATSPRRTIEIDTSQIPETGIIDITLPDADGREHRISDLSGNVILLDFTAYSLPEHSSRMLWLRDLYTRYHERGLEIFQIGFDPDQHYWAVYSDPLPWTCVYCAEGVNADILRLYNVQALPSVFLIDRSCSLHARGDQLDDIETEIQRLL